MDFFKRKKNGEKLVLYHRISLSSMPADFKVCYIIGYMSENTFNLLIRFM